MKQPKTKTTMVGEPSPELVKMAQAAAAKICRHVDAKGFCTNEDNQGGGFRCTGCEEFEPGGPCDNDAGKMPALPVNVDAEVMTDEAVMAHELRNQYRAAWDAHAHAEREAVKFGGLLLDVENFFTREKVPRGGKSGKGLGLQTWLEKHCPEINYNTAMRWRRVAKMINERATLPPGADFATALQEPSGAVATALNEALDTVIDGRSLRQLMFDFGDGDGNPKNKRGRPAGRPAHDAVFGPGFGDESNKTPEEIEADARKLGLTLLDNATAQLAAFLEGEYWRVIGRRETKNKVLALKDKLTLIAAELENLRN